MTATRTYLHCSECEGGRCPCGTGCAACEFTGSCAECHGTERADTAPDSGDATKPRSRATCTTCGRFGKQLPGPPDFRYLLRGTKHAVNTFPLRMRALRCCGCHREFRHDRDIPGTYRLNERAT